MGRFTQTDPLRGNRPFEHYAYASNNPVSRIDPMGLAPNDHDEHLKIKGEKARAKAKALEAEAGSQYPGPFTHAVNMATLGLLIDVPKMQREAMETAARAEALQEEVRNLEASGKLPRERESQFLEPIGALDDPFVMLFTGTGWFRSAGKMAPKVLTIERSALPAAERLRLPPVVIGESIDRVSRVARTEGADTFKLIPQIRRSESFEAMMAENERWMRRRLSEGRTVIDLGLDANKFPRSDFYKMERKVMQEFLEQAPKSVGQP